MRTVEGPLCFRCGLEMYRAVFATEHATHGEWVHYEETECKGDVGWIVKE